MKHKQQLYLPFQCINHRSYGGEQLRDSLVSSLGDNHLNMPLQKDFVHLIHLTTRL